MPRPHPHSMHARSIIQQRRYIYKFWCICSKYFANLKHAQMKVDTVSVQFGAASFIQVDVFDWCCLSNLYFLFLKKGLSHLFLQIYTFKIPPLPCRGPLHGRRGAIYTFCPRLLGSTVVTFRDVELTDGALLQQLELGRSSWFLIGHERQSATPVTAGHGHHHTSGTWAHKRRQLE